jgi:hypothetical protein
MSKLARACAVVVAVATSLAGGIAAAQIQSGVARKAAPPSVALGVPVASAKINARQRLSSVATAGSGSSLNFASGLPALRYLPDDLPTAKDPVRREAVKDGAKESGVSARGATAPGAAGAGEFAPAPGVLRANMPPVSGSDPNMIRTNAAAVGVPVIGGLLVCQAMPACRNELARGAAAFGNWMFNDGADGQAGGVKDASKGREKDVPNRGEPGDTKEGQRRTREYGPDGGPMRDYDKPHQGYERPHVHEWQNGVREHPGRDYSPWPKQGD